MSDTVPKFHICVDSPWNPISYIKNNLATVESAPFDGCVIDLTVNPSLTDGRAYLGPNCWGTKTYQYDLELAQSVSDALATPFSKFQHNLLRMNVSPGTADWGNDNHRRTVVNNFAMAARVCQQAGFRGIWFDPEQYNNAKVWITSAFGNKYSLTTLKQLAYQWGKEIIEACCKEKSNIVFMYLFGYYSANTSVPPPYNRDPTTGGNYELLPSFLDGLYENAHPLAELIHGSEDAYGFTASSSFAQWAPVYRKPSVSRTSKAKISLAWPVYTDYQQPVFDYTTDTNNTRPARTIRDLFILATQYSDRYVWSYQNHPVWLGNTPPGVNEIPTVYVNAVKSARIALGMNRDA